MSVNPTSIQSGFARSRSEALFPRLFPDLGWWCPSLNPPGGTRLHDLSSRQNWGTLTNMDAATDWVVSGGRGALDFDGSNDHVKITGPNASFINITNKYTVSFWAYRNGAATFSNIMSKGSGSTDDFDIYIYSSVLAVFHNANNGGTTSRVHFANFPDKTWTNVVITFDTSRDAAFTSTGAWQCFFNSVQQTSSSGGYGNVFPAIVNTQSSLQIGASESSSIFGSQRFFNGQLDDIRIYNRALSSTEARQLYQLGRGNMPRIRQRRYTEETAGFKAYWANRRSRIIGAGI